MTLNSSVASLGAGGERSLCTYRLTYSCQTKNTRLSKSRSPPPGQSSMQDLFGQVGEQASVKTCTGIMGRRVCSPKAHILIRDRVSQRQCRRTTARLPHLLQRTAKVPVCWHSLEGLPLLIYIGLTPLAFVWRDIPYKAAGGFVVDTMTIWCFSYHLLI